MFYANLKRKKKIYNAKVKFTNFEKAMNTEIDESLLPYKQAKISYNFNVKDGALCTGIGFKELTLPKLDIGERNLIYYGEDVKKIFKYSRYSDELLSDGAELLVIDKNGQLYFTNIVSDSPFLLPISQEQKFCETPNAINYTLNSEDSVIFTSSKDKMWVYALNKGLRKIENAPAILSMCLHYERIFAVVAGEQNKLAFSANLDPTNWQEDISNGGFIEMQDERGALEKVISFNDYVYIFRKYGVTKLSAYGNQIDFNVSHLFVSSVMLYGNTVTVCGNKILLLARDGIHIFDGYTTKRLNLGIDALFEDINNENACAIYYKNKFMLACRLNFDDDKKIGCENYIGGYKNNALIELDLSTNEIAITRGIDICSMVVIDHKDFTKVAVCFNGEHSTKLGELCESGEIFGTPLEKRWESPKSHLGYPTKLKHIKECLIKTNSPCKIEVKTEKENKVFNVDAKHISQRVKINMAGEQMSVAFISDCKGDIKISCPQIELSINE